MSGTSVLGLAFEGGVMVAADTLVSYGSMAMNRNCDRLFQVNNHTVVAASGDYADYQFLTRIIKQKQIDELQWNDGMELCPAALHSWITRVAYNKRSRFEPLMCTWLVAGLQPDDETRELKPFLGFVDKLGTAYKSNAIATGFGQHMATPLFRDLLETKKRLPTEEEARELISKCMHVLYYRDARSYPRYKLYVIKSDGVHQEGPINFQGEWSIAHFIGA